MVRAKNYQTMCTFVEVVQLVLNKTVTSFFRPRCRYLPKLATFTRKLHLVAEKFVS